MEFQAGRTHLTPEQKLDLIRQYDRQKAVNPGLVGYFWKMAASDGAQTYRNRRAKSTISYSIIGSEQAHNTVQMCTYKNASILI